jgi:hypothetical protein
MRAITINDGQDFKLTDVMHAGTDPKISSSNRIDFGSTI